MQPALNKAYHLHNNPKKANKQQRDASTFS
jgi:hypothetical protein